MLIKSSGEEILIDKFFIKKGFVLDNAKCFKGPSVSED